MKNRSRTHTPVDLETQICIGELTEIRDVLTGAQPRVTKSLRTPQQIATSGLMDAFVSAAHNGLVADRALSESTTQSIVFRLQTLPPQMRFVLFVRHSYPAAIPAL
jgi:hypothetical protein